MEIDWKEIYVHRGEARKMKFSILPRTIPWAGDFQENVDLTVEWLFREGKSDEIRFSKEEVIIEATNGWYTVESQPGQFLHCCYPQDMLKFRGQYENLRHQIMGSDTQTLSTITETAESARTLLWSAWNCLGGDGRRIEPRYDSVDKLGMPMLQPMIPPNEWEQVWTYRCYKCCEDLPKALKLWQKMQHGKIAKMQ